MKSPLVEALRQASDSSSTSEQTAADEHNTAAGQSADPGPTGEAPDADELQLTEPTDALPIDGDGILPIDGGGILPIDGGGILPIDGDGILPVDDAGSAADTEADADFYETTSLQLADDEASSLVEADEEAPLPPLPQPRSHAARRSGISRLGLYSPLLCLLLAAASIGCYFAYQGLGGGYQNRDLESLGTQIGASPGQDQVDAVESGTVRNRFELVVGPQSTARRNTRSDTARASSGVVANAMTPVVQHYETLLSDPENLTR